MLARGRAERRDVVQGARRDAARHAEADLVPAVRERADVGRARAGLLRGEEERERDRALLARGEQRGQGPGRG